MGLPLQFVEIVDQVQQFVDVDAVGQRLHAGFLIQIKYMIGAGSDGHQEEIAQPTQQPVKGFRSAFLFREGFRGGKDGGIRLEAFRRKDGGEFLLAVPRLFEIAFQGLVLIVRR